MATLRAACPTANLGGVTPCPAYTLGDLLDHVGGLAIAFTAAARKADLPGGSQGPSGDASRLEEGWATTACPRPRCPGRRLGRPRGVDRTAVAGGVEMPADVAGLVALDEPSLHGWDVARASGQPYDVDPRRSRPSTGSWPSSRGRVRRRAAPGCSGRSCPFRTTPRCSTGCWGWRAGTRAGSRGSVVG